MKRKSSEEQDQYMMEIRDLTTKCAEFKVQLKDSLCTCNRSITYKVSEMKKSEISVNQIHVAFLL
jgi:hypothetical protein